jgi:hypothetical protein
MSNLINMPAAVNYGIAAFNATIWAVVPGVTWFTAAAVIFSLVVGLWWNNYWKEALPDARGIHGSASLRKSIDQRGQVGAGKAGTEFPDFPTRR